MPPGVLDEGVFPAVRVLADRLGRSSVREPTSSWGTRLDRDHRVELPLGDDERLVGKARVPKHVEIPELLGRAGVLPEPSSRPEIDRYL
jgi:hypothetical protein